MEDWERDDFVPPKPAVNNDRWEGEDEDDDVKDNWDDDEEEKKEEGDEEPQQIVAVQPKKKKTIAQVLAEKERKKLEELEEKKKQVEAEKEEEKVLSSEEAMAEKLRRQKLQEEADLELAKETFGVNDTAKIDDMTPKSKEDFDDFRKALISKISKYEGSPYFLLFVEELCRDLALPLQPDDIKKITVSLNAISAEKIKAQKVAKGKKKGKTKASLNIGKDNLGIIDYGDDYDDYI